MNASEPCRDDWVDALVRGELPADQEEQLSLHLDRCPQCRQQVESAMAASDLWEDVRSQLVERPFDQASASLSTGQISRTIIQQSEAEGFVETSSVTAPSIQHVLNTLAPTDDPVMLGRLGHHEVQAVIGAGGMGVVLKAFDPSLDRMVAIKVLAPHLASSGAARQRFGREAKAAAAVLHPNVVAIHGVSDGGESGLPYLVMPYVRGETLQRRIDRQGSLNLTEILQVAVQVADGLSAAHQQGLVHRDIKPANIMLEDGVERVSIMDFGLARTVDDATLTQSGVIAGTPQYMSPEQARGDSIDERSDLFSLGSLLYAMSTGHPPFRAETAYGILRRITDENARSVRDVRSDLPAWLEVLTNRLHEKLPGERFQSAAEVADVLRGCLAHVQSSHAPLPDVLITERRSHVWWFRGAGAVVCMSLMWILWSSIPEQKPLPQRQASVEKSPAFRPSNENTSHRMESIASETKELADDVPDFAWSENSAIARLEEELQQLSRTSMQFFPEEPLSSSPTDGIGPLAQ